MNYKSSSTRLTSLSDVFVYADALLRLCRRSEDGLDNAIHWINLYPLYSTVGFPNTLIRWIALSNVSTTGVRSSARISYELCKIFHWFWQSKKALRSYENYFVLLARAQQGMCSTNIRYSFLDWNDLIN